MRDTVVDLERIGWPGGPVRSPDGRDSGETESATPTRLCRRAGRLQEVWNRSRQCWSRPARGCGRDATHIQRGWIGDL